MAENTFDALLRQALVEANWREWQPAPVGDSGGA